jgi:tetratricopeptide (TPR) repeat protein
MVFQIAARSSGRIACRLCRSAAHASRTAPSPIRRAPSAMPFSQAQGSSTSRRYATSTTASSLIHDPAEEEAQKHVAEGTTHLENADIKAARASYERSIEVKENSTAWFNLGVCKYHEKDLPGAIEAWEHSLKLAPESADAHTNLASAYAMSSPSRPDLAVKHLK